MGLDPDLAAAPDAATAERHCIAILEAALPSAAVVKPNLAFFEQHGSAGYAVLERLRARVPADRLLLLDAKRGDIGNTGEAYARSLFDVLGADAVTASPLMGADSVEPFLAREGRGCFLLARTSNPGAADLLEQPLSGGELVGERIVALARRWDAGRGNAGLVVGATAPVAIARLRALAPDLPLLVPGVGAQGGSLEDAVAAGLDAAGQGMIVAVSRGISAAPEGPGAAARDLCDRLAAARDAALAARTVGS